MMQCHFQSQPQTARPAGGSSEPSRALGLSAADQPSPNQPFNQPEGSLRFSLCLWVFVILFEFWFSSTAAGNWLYWRTCEALQRWARPSEIKTNLSVVLIDISELQPIPVRDPALPRVCSYTPREPLAHILRTLRAVRSLTNGPLAVGFDLDFSPEADGVVVCPEKTLPFFDECLNVASNGLPVFLGVKRMQAMGRAGWLGGEQYASLAAAISCPKGGAARIPLSYQFDGATNRLKSMSGALAEILLANRGGSVDADIGSLRARVSEAVLQTQPLASVSSFQIKEYFVDYSLREHMLVITNLSQTPENVLALAAVLSGKVVLIGDALSSRSEDTVLVPGTQAVIPGIFAHGCGSCTLDQAQMSELNGWMGKVLTLLLGAGCLLFVNSVHHSYAGRGVVSTAPLVVLLTLLVIALVLAASWVLFSKCRILYLDAVTVAAMAIVHCFCEILVGEPKWRRWRNRGLDLIGVLVLRREWPLE